MTGDNENDILLYELKADLFLKKKKKKRKANPLRGKIEMMKLWYKIQILGGSLGNLKISTQFHFPPKETERTVI